MHGVESASGTGRPVTPTVSIPRVETPVDEDPQDQCTESDSEVQQGGAVVPTQQTAEGDVVEETSAPTPHQRADGNTPVRISRPPLPQAVQADLCYTATSANASFPPVDRLQDRTHAHTCALQRLSDRARRPAHPGCLPVCVYDAFSVQMLTTPAVPTVTVGSKGASAPASLDNAGSLPPQPVDRHAEDERNRVTATAQDPTDVVQSGSEAVGPGDCDMHSDEQRQEAASNAVHDEAVQLTRPLRGDSITFVQRRTARPQSAPLANTTRRPASAGAGFPPV